MGSWIVSWKNMNFIGLSMPKFKGLRWKKTSLVGDLLQFTRFGWLRFLVKSWWPNGSNKSSKSSHWALMVEFFEILGGFERMCFFMSFRSAKSQPQIEHFSNVGGQLEKTTVLLVGVGWRGGVPRKRKSWGFEDWRAFRLGFSTPLWRWRRI